MNIIQFSPTVGYKGGREYMMERIAKELDAPVYTISKDGSLQDEMQLVTYTKLLDNINMAKGVSPDIPTNGVDVILGHSALSPLMLSGVDTPVVVLNTGCFREYTTLYNDFAGNINKTKKFFIDSRIKEIRGLLQTVLLEADLHITGSENERDVLHDWFNIHSSTNLHPINWNYFKNTKPTGDYFLWVGRPHWAKRPEIAIEAFRSLNQELRIVGGNGFYSDNIRGYCKNVDNINYYGHISMAELRDMYSGARATIHTGVAEDLSTVIRESMAAGTPAIAVDIDSNHEILEGGYGKLFSDNEPVTELRNAVNEFNGSDYDPDKLRAEAEYYSVDNYAKRLEDILEEKL
jgi:glycosyltransferase involved in cell wall biosynthesis